MDHIQLVFKNSYPMEIKSLEPCTYTRRIADRYVDIRLEVGMICIVNPEKCTTKKDRKNKGRIADILGFSDSFMPKDVIIKYLDTGRRGMVNPCDLLPDSLNNW